MYVDPLMQWGIPGALFLLKKAPIMGTGLFQTELFCL